MKRLRRHMRRLKVRLSSLSRPAALAAGALVLLIVAGAIWMASSASSSPLAEVSATRLSGEALASARKVLADHRIPTETRDGKLLVPSSQLAAARAALAQAGATPARGETALQDLPGDGELWLTGDEKAQRWLAAKMATLGRLIAQFPQVRSATVLLDVGSPRRLGSQSVRPTAAVNVVLNEGAVMTADLVDAIADQIAASVAGMRRDDVRIVDSAGRSYCAVETHPASDEPLAKVRVAEAYFREKVRGALHYIPNLSVSADVAMEGEQARCLAANVSVPRSYFAGVYRTQRPGAAEPTDAELLPTITAHLPQVEQSVRKVLARAAPPKLEVGWYYDVVPGAAAGGKAAVVAKDTSDGGSAGSARFLLAATLPVLLAAALAVLIVRRRRRRCQAAACEPRGEGLAAEFAVAQQAQRARQDSRGAEPLDEEPFAFLQDIRRDDVVSLIEDEHPQTIALVLAHFAPARAAGILAALPPGRQVEVVRRVADLGPVDPAALREVREHLAARLADVPPGGEIKVGGVGKIAEILHHAGYATEQKVLDGLSDQQPELADSIRNRMFVFEDIARMPSHRLRPALEPLEADELAIALRTAGEDLKKKVFSSLPARAAREVRDEMEQIGPVRLSDVEAAQSRVMDAIRRAERGEYATGRSETQSEILA